MTSLSQVLAARARLVGLSHDDAKLRVDLGGVEFVQKAAVATGLYRNAAHALAAAGRASWPLKPSQAAARVVVDADSKKSATVTIVNGMPHVAVDSSVHDDAALKVVRHALTNGLPPNAVVAGASLLHVAASAGCKHAVVALVASGAPIGMRTLETVDGDVGSDLNEPGGGRFLAIELAAAAGHVDIVRWLATHGSPHGRALAFAAACGSFGTTRVLLASGANADARCLPSTYALSAAEAAALAGQRRVFVWYVQF